MVGTDPFDHVSITGLALESYCRSSSKPSLINEVICTVRWKPKEDAQICVAATLFLQWWTQQWP